MLINQELLDSKNESDEIKDIEMNVWYTQSDRIRNEDIRDNVEVTYIMNKLREGRLEMIGAYGEKMCGCPNKEV